MPSSRPATRLRNASQDCVRKNFRTCRRKTCPSAPQPPDARCRPVRYKQSDLRWTGSTMDFGVFSDHTSVLTVDLKTFVPTHPNWNGEIKVANCTACENSFDEPAKTRQIFEDVWHGETNNFSAQIARGIDQVAGRAQVSSTPAGSPWGRHSVLREPMLRWIIGCRLSVSRYNGKWKSQ